MPTIAEFDERMLILNSLIRRKEVPEQWDIDPRYSIAFETVDNRVSRVTVTLEGEAEVTVIEYEPMFNKAKPDEQSLFMLKTSEHRQRALTAIS